MDRGQWDNFPGCRGYTPTLFSKDILGFLMTTENQDLGFMKVFKKLPRICFCLD